MINGVLFLKYPSVEIILIVPMILNLRKLMNLPFLKTQLRQIALNVLSASKSVAFKMKILILI